MKTLSRHPKCAFHARYDWKITFADWKQKNFEKIFEKFFFEFFFMKKTSKTSHSAEKWKGGPLGFINILSVAKYQNTRRGDSFETLKNFRKKSHSAEKKSKEGPRPVL